MRYPGQDVYIITYVKGGKPVVSSFKFWSFSAVLLMGEPVDWGRDLQLIIDLLMTNGQPDKVADGVPTELLPVIACSADLLFMDQAPMPR